MDEFTDRRVGSSTRKPGTDGTDLARRARFEKIARDVFEPLQRYLRRRARPDDAADVFNDTLLVVWRRLDDVPIDDPLPWCYGTARRCLANHRRSAARHLALADRAARQPAASLRFAPPVDHALDDPDLSAAIATLSEHEAEIVRLWAWEGLEPRQIAAALGQPANAVSVALSRAKRKLRNVLDDRQDPPRAGQEPVGSNDTNRNDGSDR